MNSESSNQPRIPMEIPSLPVYLPQYFLIDYNLVSVPYFQTRSNNNTKKFHKKKRKEKKRMQKPLFI